VHHPLPTVYVVCLQPASGIVLLGGFGSLSRLEGCPCLLSGLTCLFSDTLGG
jgi:hypothetical protein